MPVHDLFSSSHSERAAPFAPRRETERRCGPNHPTLTSSQSGRSPIGHRKRPGRPVAAESASRTSSWRRGDRAGSGEARRTSLAFIRIRSRRAPHVGQSDASGNASAGRSHTPLSTACVEEKRRTTLEDGSLGSERGNDSERRARERVRTRSHPGSCRGSAVAFPDLAGALSFAIPRARRLALDGCAASQNSQRRISFDIFFCGVEIDPEAAEATTSFAHPREIRIAETRRREASCTGVTCITRTRAPRA